MSSSPNPHELGELTVRRLNRAASDLGLAPSGSDLFVLDEFSFDLTEEDAADSPLEPGLVEIIDIALTLEDIEGWSDLASRMERLAERFADMEQAQRTPKPFDPNQQQLPLAQG